MTCQCHVGGRRQRSCLLQAEVPWAATGLQAGIYPKEGCAAVNLQSPDADGLIPQTTGVGSWKWSPKTIVHHRVEAPPGLKWATLAFWAGSEFSSSQRLCFWLGKTPFQKVDHSSRVISSLYPYYCDCCRTKSPSSCKDRDLLHCESDPLKAEWRIGYKCLLCSQRPETILALPLLSL